LCGKRKTAADGFGNWGARPVRKIFRAVQAMKIRAEQAEPVLQAYYGRGVLVRVNMAGVFLCWTSAIVCPGLRDRNVCSI